MGVDTRARTGPRPHCHRQDRHTGCRAPAGGQNAGIPTLRFAVKPEDIESTAYHGYSMLLPPSRKKRLEERRHEGVRCSDHRLR